MKFCPECGAKLVNESTKFCPDCGANINGKAPSKVEAPISPKPVDPLIEEYEHEVLPDGTYAVIKPKDACKTKYVIPEGVSVIRHYAFETSNAELVKEVVLPNSLRIIEGNAFSNEELSKVNFPAGLEKIDDSAFANTDISEVILPSTIKELGSDVFSECDINKIVLPKSLKEIPNGIFSKSRIKTITIPSNIERICEYAFEKASIEEITFEEGLKVISDSAFLSAYLPETIYLPSTLLKVDAGAFEYSSIKTIVYDGDLIDKSSFKEIKIISSKTIEQREKTRKATLDDKKARGIVAWAGTTDSKKYNVKKVDNIAFYIKDGCKIVGWESTVPVKQLQIPDGCCWIERGCLKNIETIIYPRTMTEIEISTEHCISDFLFSDVKQIIIPREAKKVTILNFRIMRVTTLDSIQEIKFEDPTGWNVSRSVLEDREEFISYLYANYTRELRKSGIKALLKNIFGG